MASTLTLENVITEVRRLGGDLATAELRVNGAPVWATDEEYSVYREGGVVIVDLTSEYDDE